MDTFFLTTFNKELFDEYANKFIESYLNTEQQVPLVCYVEEDDFSIYPQHKNITYFNLFKESQEISKFIDRNKNRPVPGYRYDAIRFCYKVYAQCSGRTLGKRQVFIDADCVFLESIPLKWFDEFIEDKDFAYYPRQDYYSETGFVMYNCESETVQKFFDAFVEMYNTDKVYTVRTQNDSVIFDVVLRFFPNRTEKLHGENDKLDLKYHRHVMARCPILSPYIDHKKGNRKKMSKSPELIGV
jgi:hypothetical protein